MIIKQNRLIQDCKAYSTIRIEPYNLVFDGFPITPCCVYNKPIGILTKNDILNNNVFNVITDIYKNPALKIHFKDKCYTVGIDIKRVMESYQSKCDFNKNRLTNIDISCTRTCNLNCTMCRNNVITESDNDYFYFLILKQLKGHNLEQISLNQNGEPFYHKKETMDYIKSLKYDSDCKILSIISNLTLLNDNDIYDLIDIEKNNHIKINITASIDGITEETYKKIRRNNLFNKVIHNVELLANNNILNIINFVISEENIHEFELAEDFWHNINKDLCVYFIPKNYNKDYYNLIKTYYTNRYNL